MEAVAAIGSASEASRFRDSTALVVDLDGTLIKTDLLLESVLVLLKQKPYYALLLLAWLVRGKAHLKRQVARRVSLAPAVLPYNGAVLDYLKEQRAHGRKLVLATAGDILFARRVADHLGLFDFVYASDGRTNLSGASKRDRLVRELGEKRFDYVGNSRNDLAVWASARNAVLVNASRSVLRKARQVADVERVFSGQKNRWIDYVKPLRLEHWFKNALLFVPLLAAHRFDEIGPLGTLLLAFGSFGCFASSGYLINDLFDLPADRHHPTKRLRPFASGALPLGYALGMIPVLAGAGCIVGAMVSGPFLDVALSYFAMTVGYSLYLKRIALLDVIILAGLYSMRIMAGTAAIALWPSHWLLAFSTFLFLSLALVKRYGELVIMRKIDGDHATARGYELDDSELLAAMGVASGFLAVLVLALYVTSVEAQALYGHYELIWSLCPLLLYWIGRMWLIAHRGKMPDDPVVFALRDRISRILLLLMAISVAVAL